MKATFMANARKQIVPAAIARAFLEPGLGRFRKSSTSTASDIIPKAAATTRFSQYV